MRTYRIQAAVVAYFDVEAEGEAEAFAAARETLDRWDEGSREPERGIDLRLFRPVESYPVGPEPEIEDVSEGEVS